MVLVLSTLSGCVAQRADTDPAPVTASPETQKATEAPATPADGATPDPTSLESTLSMGDIAVAEDSLSYRGYRIDRREKAAIRATPDGCAVYKAIYQR